MPTFDPASIAADTGGIWHDRPGRAITGFSIDTRSLQPGEIFVALPTRQRDGHDFLGDAMDRGAAGAMVSRLVGGVPLAQLQVDNTLAALQSLARAHRGRFSGTVVGVTGSAGKTSTKELLAAVLGIPEEVLATHGNLNNHLGVPLTLLRIDPQRHHFAVVEVGINAPGEMALLAPMVAPAVTVVTTIGAAHLEGLKSVEGVAREKAVLAAAASDAVVMTASTRRYPAFRGLAARCLVVAGLDEDDLQPDPGEQVVPFARQHRGEETHVCVTWRGAVEEFSVPRTTAGMAANLALAAVAALHLGGSSDLVRERLPRWRPAALRGEISRERGRLVYLDCYNANPVSMRDAVEGFAGMAPESEPRLYVIGCMEELGDATATLHRDLGEHWPLREGDQLIVLGDQAAALAEGVRARKPQASVLINPDPPSVARIIREFAGAVFLKGSRRYALERLWNTGRTGTAEESEVAA